MSRILWRDSAMTWPSLRIQLHLLPWSWRLVPRGYYDYSPGWHDPAEKDSRAGWWGVTGQWLMVEIDFGLNLPPFTFEREGCDCAELCSMGPTCPGGMLAGVPGSGCWREDGRQGGECSPRPCGCLGHSVPGVYHMRPCCDVPHVPDHDYRDDATAIGDSTGYGGPVGGGRL